MNRTKYLARESELISVEQEDGQRYALFSEGGKNSLNIDCTVETSDDEIEKFVDWISPFLKSWMGAYLGFMQHDDAAIPTLIFYAPASHRYVVTGEKSNRDLEKFGNHPARNIDNKDTQHDIEQICQELLITNPGEKRLWVVLGTILARQKKYQDAKRAYDEVAHLDINYWKQYNILGAAHYSEAFYRDVQYCFERYLDLHPDNSITWFSMGCLRLYPDYYAKDHNEEEEYCQFAIKCFTMAFQLDKTNPEIQYGLGRVYHLVGDFDASLRVMKPLVEAHPTNVKYLVELYYLYSRVGNYPEAERTIQMAINVPRNCFPSYREMRATRDGNLWLLEQLYELQLRRYHEENNKGKIEEVWQKMRPLYERHGEPIEKIVNGVHVLSRALKDVLESFDRHKRKHQGT